MTDPDLTADSSRRTGAWPLIHAARAALTEPLSDSGVSSRARPSLPCLYYQGSDLVVVAKGRIGGLKLVAEDGPFTTGSGPLVSGPTLALVMAMTGRATYCNDLEGDGVELLRSRCGTA